MSPLERWKGLTPRQQTIALLLTQGTCFRNKQIAKHLHTTEAQVKHDRCLINRKLATTGLVALVRTVDSLLPQGETHQEEPRSMLTYHFTQTHLCLVYDYESTYIPLLALGQAIDAVQMENLKKTLAEQERQKAKLAEQLL